MLKKANQAMEEALRVIALSYKYRIDKKDTPPYEYATTVLEELGISLESIPEGKCGTGHIVKPRCVSCKQFSLEVPDRWSYAP